MAGRCRCWAALVLLACLPLSAAGQELPKATPEGKKAAEELIQACIADGGLKQVGEGPKATWQVDPAKVQATLAARKERLTPEVRDALVAAYADVAFDPERGEERTRILGVLRAMGAETRDPLARGFASFFTGFEQQGRLQLSDAVESFEGAAKHFAAVPDREWQAQSLSNLGLVLHSQGEYGKAQGCFEEALEMRRKLYPPDRYPQGHPDLAQCLNNLGPVLQAQGEYGKAQGCFEEALEMCRKLYPPGRYPQGHPHLAQCLNNLGSVRQDQGEYGKALGFYEQALQNRRTSPDLVPLGDGPLVATSLLPDPDTLACLRNRSWLLRGRLVGHLLCVRPLLPDRFSRLGRRV
jgi:tetratricopeptide (TPR) repeat protein